MRYLLLLFLLIGCSAEHRHPIDMKEFAAMCASLSKDVGATNYHATAWYEEDKSEYKPSCSLDFQYEKTETLVSYYTHHLDEKELRAIEYYRKNKK